jgi:hypothetical protein
MATLILGFVLGLLVSPILRSWIVWREYRDASRQASLAEQTLRWLEDQDRSSEESASESRRPRSA